MNKLTFYRKPAFMLILLLLTFLSNGFAVVAAQDVARNVTIGQKDSLEQRIVASATAELLRHDGFEVAIDDAKDTAQIRAALRRGEIDFYWEYTGTGLTVFNRYLERLPASKQFPKLRELDAKVGLYWIEPSYIQNSFALVMDKRRADGFGISSISDLAAHIRDGWAISFGVGTEFYSRPDGLNPLQTAYDFKIDNRLIRHGKDHNELRKWLLDGEIDVMASSRTELWPDHAAIQPIADDQGFFPNYILAPVIRTEVLSRHPELEKRLTDLGQRLNNSVILKLSDAASSEDADVQVIARDFLVETGLVEAFLED